MRRNTGTRRGETEETHEGTRTHQKVSRIWDAPFSRYCTSLLLFFLFLHISSPFPLALLSLGCLQQLPFLLLLLLPRPPLIHMYSLHSHNYAEINPHHSMSKPQADEEMETDYPSAVRQPAPPRGPVERASKRHLVVVLEEACLETGKTKKVGALSRFLRRGQWRTSLRAPVSDFRELPDISLLFTCILMTILRDVGVLGLPTASKLTFR